jgi:hypothetical protein
MSKFFKNTLSNAGGTATILRGLPLLLKHLLISGVVALAGLGTAQAELTIKQMDPGLINAPAKVQKSAASSIYIVQMKGNPAVSYEGDVAGYQATKPGKGKKINPNSAM